MTSVGIERDALQLRSCPSCGEHAWVQAGRRLGRSDLLAALRTTSGRAAGSAARSTGTRSPTGAPPVKGLQEMLKGFRPHGSSS